MIPVTENTKISALIAADARVIDKIAEINQHFTKLRNPVLRKILASRVTVSDAARIGKCSVETIFEKLRPLGFTITTAAKPDAIPHSDARVLHTSYDFKLDVRQDIANGADPFTKIMQELTTVAQGETLLLINSFEPTPLLRILHKQGYETQVVQQDENTVYTYIHRTVALLTESTAAENGADFDQIARLYHNQLRTIDVRALPMPQPMVAILHQLETLPEGMALLVQHKKMPMFLLPELKERGYELVFNQEEQGVRLIIYKL